MKNDIRYYWEKIGHKYALTWQVGGRKYISSLEESFIKNILESLPKHKIKALDLGCGTGRISAVLERSEKINSLYGVDFSRPMLDYCQKRFRKSKKIEEFILSDISKKLPFKNNHFDLITSIRVIKYNQNWPQILNECYRILKKDGLFVFEMPNKNSVNRLAQYEVPIYSTTERQLGSILTKIGFKILTVEGGPVLPGFIYDNVKSKSIAALILKTERVFKYFLGETLFARFIYVACQK